MSLLWVNAARRTGMAWWDNDIDHDYEEGLRPEGETLPERGNRFVKQISEAHGVDEATARGAAKQILHHVQNGTQDPRAYGFASASGSRHDHYSIPEARAIMDHRTWKGKRVQDVDLTEGVHATQNYVDADRVAHNLFHPGKKAPWAQPHAVGDPDYDPDWDGDDEEGSGLEMDHDSVQNRRLENHTRFIRRDNGDLEVADGHHRVAADLLLGKTHTPGIVLHEHELRKHMDRRAQQKRGAWEQDHAENESTHPTPLPVEKAGYAGWVTGKGMEEEGDIPHHYNDALMDHLLTYNGPELRQMSQHGRIKLDRPVYATQSHITQEGLLKHMHGGARHLAPENKPRFIKHQGNLYVDDGHHRVGAALLRGDPDIEGYYYDADKKGFPEPPEDQKWW